MVRASRGDLVARVLDAGRELGAASVLFHSTVAARFGFGATDVKTLDLLQRRGPLTPKELAELTGLAPASVTGIVDRLQQKGFLRRVAHPVDGRRLHIELDPSAVVKFAPLYEDLTSSLTEMLEGYTSEQLQLLATAFQESARRQMTAALRIANHAQPAG